jgi:ABC-2 type transport system ATP-binding protein
MPDNFGVYDGMKVWEFLDFFAVAYQIPRSRRKAVIGDVLELLDLTHKRDDFVNGLSRGMKQRLCLAKTLVHDPPVLILDEPVSGLDPHGIREVREIILRERSRGRLVFLSSHVLSEIERTADRVGIIRRGRLLYEGTVGDILARYTTLEDAFVAMTGEATPSAALA